MNIKKIDIGGFGKLENRSIELENGLNVIYAPNESGKSTLAAFIKFALYGFAKKERSSEKNPVTSKLRYIPWSGQQAEGSITCEYNGREYVISRQARKTAQTLSVNDAVTGVSVPLRAEPGEEFFGIGLDTFESTAYFNQGSFSDMKMDELESKLKNMATGGDESVSYEKASAKLKQLINKINTIRTTSKGGALQAQRQNILARMGQLKAQGEPDTEAIERMQQRLDELDMLIPQQKEKTASAERLISESRAKSDAERRREYEKANDACIALAEKYEGLSRDAINRETVKYYKYKNILSGFDGVPIEPKKKNGWIGLLIPGLLGLAAGCALLYFKLLYYGIIAASVGLALCVASLIWMGTAQGRYKKAMDKFYADSEIYDEAEKAMEEVTEFSESYDGGEIPGAFDFLNGVLDEIAERKFKLQQAIGLLGSDNRVDDSAFIREKQTLDILEQERNTLKIRLAEGKSDMAYALSRREEIVKLEGEIADIDDAIAKCEADDRIVKAAYNALEKAHDEMTHLFAPALNAKAERNMQLFTGGRRTLTVDSSGTVRIGENGVIRSLGYYSAGTIDAAYISVRLACIDIIYEKDPPPLIFDDTFCNLDEDRTISMLRMLDGIGAQVIYFTCRNPRPFLNGVNCRMIEM